MVTTSGRARAASCQAMRALVGEARRPGRRSTRRRPASSDASRQSAANPGSSSVGAAGPEGVGELGEHLALLARRWAGGCCCVITNAATMPLSAAISPMISAGITTLAANRMRLAVRIVLARRRRRRTGEPADELTRQVLQPSLRRPGRRRSRRARRRATARRSNASVSSSRLSSPPTQACMASIERVVVDRAPTAPRRRCSR